MGKNKETNDYLKREILSAFSIKAPAIFAAVCIFIGTVFTFGMWYWGETISRSEAIADTAIFESYKINRGNTLKDYDSSIKEIEINFNDREKSFIDGASVSAEVLDALENLSSGETVRLLMHPNSNVIVEMKNGDETILDFDDAMGDLRRENIMFAVLGVFMYGMAVLGIVSVVRLIKERKEIVKNLDSEDGE